MATAKKQTAAAKPKKTTESKTSSSRALTKWDEELARQAEAAAAVEASTATGSFFSLKGGTLSINDSPVPNNEMAVIILDSILENVYYGSDYDPDAMSPPKCFAFGRDEKTMKPHVIPIESGHAQAEQCQGCEWNEYGSADRGRGKACRNTRRLAMIPAGTFDERGKLEPFEDDSFETAQISFMKLPVTSVRGYAAFVKQIAGALKRPPLGVFTRVSVVDDPDTQFKVVFEPLSTVPDEIMATIMQRAEEARGSIEQPYQAYDEEEVASRKPARGRGKSAAKTAVGKGAAAKGKRY